MNTTFSEAGLARVLEAVKKEPRHTPGPWAANYHRKYRQWNLFDSTGCGEAIAIVENVACTRSDEDIAANARLIAAAPDLLDALQTLVSRIEFYSAMGQAGQVNIEQWGYTEGSSDMQKARAAIAKATGEQS